MPPKKGKTKKPQKKRDFIDFLVDASKEDSTVADGLLELLKRKGTKAKDLYQYLKDLNYTVSLPGMTKMFKAYKSETRPRVKAAVTEQGY